VSTKKLSTSRATITDTIQVAFRLPAGLVARLDEYAAKMMAAKPGLAVSRTDVVRVLLGRALDGAAPVPRRAQRR
jgi:hypothetical protein